MTEHNLTIKLATTNKDKFKEAASIVALYGIRLQHLNLEKHEIQADSLAKIARIAASEFVSNGKARSVLTDDSGFFVDSLKGFPGPYSSYVFETIGSKGILKLLGNAKNRRASFRAALAYCEVRHQPVLFNGEVNGVVTRESRGNSGFGYDPIFVPKFGDGRTFGEMGMKEKNRFSHRAIAFSRFCEWYLTRKYSKPKGKLNNRILERTE